VLVARNKCSCSYVGIVNEDNTAIFKTNETLYCALMDSTLSDGRAENIKMMM
jgi:hypothetical protein